MKHSPLTAQELPNPFHETDTARDKLEALEQRVAVMQRQINALTDLVLLRSVSPPPTPSNTANPCQHSD